MVMMNVRNFGLALGIIVFAVACGVKRPPTPIYATHPFEDSSSTEAATPSPTPTPSPQPTKKKSK